MTLLVYAYLTDPLGRLLLLMTGDRRDWVLPGGDVGPYESRLEAAAYHARRILHVAVKPLRSAAVTDDQHLIHCRPLTPRGVASITLPPRPSGKPHPAYLDYAFAPLTALPPRMRAGHRHLVTAALRPPLRVTS
ncbi:MULTISPECIES: hypothetical protein [Streptomyces]|uniref:NUDIX hydrolase n=1 Tax=Streptomyces luteosporeus TaxID=173856 RepID=A0ABP6G040_9ACTN